MHWDTMKKPAPLLLQAQGTLRGTLTVCKTVVEPWETRGKAKRQSKWSSMAWTHPCMPSTTMGPSGRLTCWRNDSPSAAPGFWLCPEFWWAEPLVSDPTKIPGASQLAPSPKGMWKTQAWRKYWGWGGAEWTREKWKLWRNAIGNSSESTTRWHLIGRMFWYSGLQDWGFWRGFALGKIPEKWNFPARSLWDTFCSWMWLLNSLNSIHLAESCLNVTKDTFWPVD